ncbi:hypothetical protein [Halorhabdus salina]|uniref:hypothetical protein n=1 Tax=Halorhabdus salina TaxID=2750670 RepID=UPI0015EEC05D|nr:hypothetical protein [Halorhabdus salina]
MATEEAEPPEGFTTVEQPGNNDSDDYDTDWIDRPEVGDLVQGNLLAIKPDRGEYDSTVLEIKLTQPYGDHDEGDLVAMWSTQGIDAALDEAGSPRGEELAVWCDETYDLDGDEVRNFELAVKEA